MPPLSKFEWYIAVCFATQCFKSLWHRQLCGLVGLLENLEVNLYLLTDFRVAFSPFSYSHVLKNHWESSSQQHTVNLQNRHFRSRAQESNDSTFKLTTTSGNQQKVKTGKEDFLPGQCILRKLVVLAGFMHKNVEVRLNFYCSRKKTLWKRWRVKRERNVLWFTIGVFINHSSWNTIVPCFVRKIWDVLLRKLVVTFLREVRHSLETFVSLL